VPPTRERRGGWCRARCAAFGCAATIEVAKRLDAGERVATAAYLAALD
jgi:hypothetical protein